MSNVTFKEVNKLIDLMVKIALQNEREEIAKICEKLGSPVLADVVRNRNE